MNNWITIRILVLANVFIFSMTSLSHAQSTQYDRAYLKWKEAQAAQDEKLKRVDSNYYLSRPSVESSASSKQTSAKHSSASMSGTAKISINTGNINDLQQLNGVGEKKAQAIIEYREKQGKFKSVDELQNVKGIGPKFVEKNRDRLSL
jgi:competence protein ComEA